MNDERQSSDEANRDQDVLLLLQQRDPRAAERLIEVFGDRIYGLSLRILNSEEDAKEAVQETFLTVWRKWDTFKGKSRFSSWIYRIAANSAFMNLRRRRKQRSELSLEQMDDGSNADPMMLVYEHALQADLLSAKAPDQELQAQELQTMIKRAVDALPEIYRTAYLLKDVEGLPLKEIAEIMEISEAAAKSRVHRARLELRQMLAPYLR